MNSKCPLVSIIVPVYNVEQYLCRCVDSILNQTYQNLEIFLVNDGSTDGSPALCDRYSLMDKRVKVIHKDNGGLSSARNAAIACMAGDYVMFVDSDDYVSSNIVETFLACAIANDSEVVVGGYAVVSGGSVVRGDYVSEGYSSDGIEVSKAIIRDVFPHNFAWGKLYRSSLFDRIRFPEGRLYEDTAIIYKVVAEANRVYCASGIYYYYEMGRPNNTTSELNSIKAVRSYHDGLLNCIERIEYITQHPIFVDVRHDVERQMNTWALLLMQTAVSISYKNTKEEQVIVVDRMKRAGISPSFFALKLAVSSTGLYYVFEKLMAMIRKTRLCM